MRRIARISGSSGAVRFIPCALMGEPGGFVRLASESTAAESQVSQLSNLRARPQDLRFMLPGGRVEKSGGDASVRAPYSSTKSGRLRTRWWVRQPTGCPGLKAPRSFADCSSNYRLERAGLNKVPRIWRLPRPLNLIR